MTRFFGWEPEAVDRLTLRRLLWWNEHAHRLAREAAAAAKTKG